MSPPERCWLPSSQFPLHKRSRGAFSHQLFEVLYLRRPSWSLQIIFLEARATLPYLSLVFFLRFCPPGASSAAHRRHRRAAERLSLWSTFCAQRPCNCIRPLPKLVDNSSPLANQRRPLVGWPSL
ncbi:hypothetical protein GGI35DRAFT_333946 [Trichoderma velutinum]